MSFEDDIAPPAAVRTFTFSTVFLGGSDKPVALECKHAGFSNTGLTAAQLKSFNERKGRRGDGTGGSITPEMIEADRVLDAKLFAKHVVTGWENVIEDGKPVPFSSAKCEELLLALSKKRLDLFRLFTNWASNADNFTDAPTGDPADLGK